MFAIMPSISKLFTNRGNFPGLYLKKGSLNLLRIEEGKVPVQFGGMITKV
jgi:hypothetical protein